MTKPPKDLGPAGRRLFTSIADEFDLEIFEELLLLEAARCADRLDTLAAAQKGADLVITNSRGDLVTSPFLVEARMQQINLTRLLASLRLPQGESDARPQRRGAARGAYVRSAG